MKLAIWITLLLTGCCGNDIEQVKPDNLKFGAGDEVETTVAFYRKCHGTVEGFFPYKDVKADVDYNVSFYCSGAGRIEDVRIPESKLIKKEDK